jgi:glycosyltransferase involved in cell wall biosynthesis
MIRLLSVQPVAERGGSDQALLRMVRSLPSDEFDCHVALPARSPLAEDFAAAGATLHVVPMRRLSRSHRACDWAVYCAAWPFTVTRLARLARDLDVDVVHTNSLHCLHGWAASAVARRPHVWHAREIVVQSGPALRLERFLARRFASRVIAMSCAVATQLDPTNVEVVYETADPAEFRPSLAGSFRAGVGIPDDVVLVGVTSRLDVWKGIDVLLDAFVRAREQRPELHLAVAGAVVDGKEAYAATLRSRVDALQNASWLGLVTDIAALYADLDLFVLPSTEPEPYGLVVVEALASGVPVVVTDAGGPPEILAFATPGAGRTVPRGHAAALALAIAEMAPPTTSVATRAARPPLVEPRPHRFADVFRQVAGPRTVPAPTPGDGPVT